MFVKLSLYFGHHFGLTLRKALTHRVCVLPMYIQLKGEKHRSVTWEEKSHFVLGRFPLFISQKIEVFNIFAGLKSNG
jgi:hypothetical protein